MISDFDEFPGAALRTLVDGRLYEDGLARWTFEQRASGIVPVRGRFGVITCTEKSLSKERQFPTHTPTKRFKIKIPLPKQLGVIYQFGFNYSQRQTVDRTEGR